VVEQVLDEVVSGQCHALMVGAEAATLVYFAGHNRHTLMVSVGSKEDQLLCYRLGSPSDLLCRVCMYVWRWGSGWEKWISNACSPRIMF
jgi:hypothetical protein